MDQAFPGSRFILTVRKNADEWFESVVRFETQFIGKGRLPSAQDLKDVEYLSPGWLWRSHQLISNVDEAGLYDPVRYKAHYERHNESIRDYFSQRPRDLLVLDLSEPSPVEKVCDFLEMPRLPVPMPHLNSSR
jgi:hypothetical protein